MKNVKKESFKLDFEKKLYIALKSHGFLFPTTEKEVEEFENRMGNTEMELPTKFRGPENILRKGASSDEVIPEDFETKMAAYNINEDIDNKIDWDALDDEDKSF